MNKNNQCSVLYIKLTGVRTY